MAYTKGLFTKIEKEYGLNGFAAAEVGIHALTLNAGVRRGYLEKIGKNYCLTPKGLIFNKIEAAVRPSGFIVLKRCGAALGMLCSVKGMDVLDAWDQPWDFDENVEIINC